MTFNITFNIIGYLLKEQVVPVTVCVCVCFRDVKRVLFVPYALHDRDAYTRTARDKFTSLGSFSTCTCFCDFLFVPHRL